jgi:hypothetical protein
MNDKRNNRKKKMKQKMNQVTPKAGTLKQTNEIQNALRKLIASVLMLAVLLMNPGSIMAAMKAGDSCCKTAKRIDLSKTVTLPLPSSEMVKRADTEITVNLFNSLKESKVSKFASLFAVSDAKVNALFISETTIGLPVVLYADERVSIDFAAENLSFPFAAEADACMHALFTVEEAGIRQSYDVVSADEQMNTMFNAENIGVPGDESFAKADTEINRNMKDEWHIILASNN